MSDKMMTFLCRGCANVISIPSRRGRPPKFCSKCLPLSMTTITTTTTTTTTKATASLAVETPSVQNVSKMMTYFCKQCSEIIAIPSRRGRPPQFCQKCTNSGEIPSFDERKAEERLITAKERVDRLEIMLKARGTHISQHRDRW